MNELEVRYLALLQTIAATSRLAATPRPVRLLAVSKGQPAAAMRDLYALGQRSFGENYAQEMVSKAAALGDLPGLEFVFIGRIQSNKIPAIVRAAAAVQSLASERHARLVAAAVRAAGKVNYPVHLLINAGDEASKDGLNAAAAKALAHVISASLPELRLRGVMAIPPPLGVLTLAADGSGVPLLFYELRQLADGIGEGDLSLGMSADLKPAILAGSDSVRVGTALFGERRPAIAAC